MSLIRTLTQLRQALQQRRRARIHARLAAALYQQEAFAEAAAEYEQALRLHPHQPAVRLSLGLALYKAGRKADARACWQQVLDEAGTASYLAEQAHILLRQFG